MSATKEEIAQGLMMNVVELVADLEGEVQYLQEEVYRLEERIENLEYELQQAKERGKK